MAGGEFMDDGIKEVDYFTTQIDLNPKIDFKSRIDYCHVAKSSYDRGLEFFNLSVLGLNCGMKDYFNAINTNISFACEFLLKSMLYYYDIQETNQHNLFKLYKKLPQRMQEEIYFNHPCTNIPRDRFETSLKQLGNSFAVFRYSYERLGLAWNGLFFYELVMVLQKTSDSVISTLKPEDYTICVKFKSST